MTGEILHVDAGYHVVGMKNPDAPDLTLDKDASGTRSVLRELRPL